MATTVNTLASMPNENKIFYDKLLLERLLPNLVFAKYGQEKPIPKNQGDTINFRRFDSYKPATTPLTEGVTPDGKTMNVTKVEAKLKQYGDYTVTTDVIDTTAIDPVVTEITAVHGEQAGLTIDTVIADVVTKGTNVMYANGTSTAEVGASNIMDSTLIKKAVRALRVSNVKPLDGNFYIGIVHPSVAFDIMQKNDLWEDVSKYNGGEEIMKGEVGRLCGVRFIQSTNAPVKSGEGASNADVYTTMIIGKGAYGVTNFKGASKPQIIVKALGSAGTGDPLNQRSSVGWKAELAAVRLNELCMIRVETGATA